MKFLSPGDTYTVAQKTPAEYEAVVSYGGSVAELAGATSFYAWCADGRFASGDAPRHVHACLGGSFMSVAQRTPHGFRPQRLVGVHAETPGRLVYIDGCSDTLLIYPPRLGDPCLNFLFLPPNIRQTMHTHPTIRAGVVSTGAGRAIWFDDGVPTETPLTPGMAFVLEPDERHCFYTDDSSLSIFAYHPDSDWGPTDEVHPMKNRTII